MLEPNREVESLSALGLLTEESLALAHSVVSSVRVSELPAAVLDAVSVILGVGTSLLSHSFYARYLKLYRCAANCVALRHALQFYWSDEGRSCPSIQDPCGTLALLRILRLSVVWNEHITDSFTIQPADSTSQAEQKAYESVEPLARGISVKLAPLFVSLKPHLIHALNKHVQPNDADKDPGLVVDLPISSDAEPLQTVRAAQDRVAHLSALVQLRVLSSAAICACTRPMIIYEPDYRYAPIKGNWGRG